MDWGTHEYTKQSAFSFSVYFSDNFQAYCIETQHTSIHCIIQPTMNVLLQTVVLLSTVLLGFGGKDNFNRTSLIFTLHTSIDDDFNFDYKFSVPE